MGCISYVPRNSLLVKKLYSYFLQ